VVDLRHVPSAAQSIALHDSDDIWAVQLVIESKNVPAPVQTVYYFWAKYRAENLPLRDERPVLFLFLSARTFHCRTAGPGRSRYYRSLILYNVPGEMTEDVFAGCRSTYLQFGFFAGISKHTSFFVVTKALSLVFCISSLIFILTFAASISSDR
jgi:hypothetical protein